MALAVATVALLTVAAIAMMTLALATMALMMWWHCKGRDKCLDSS